MSVTAAPGFSAAGVACGIKASGDPDLALVATHDGAPVAAAAVFTTNRAAAAPVEVSRLHLERTAGRAAAVVLSSGNANAGTGEPGRRDALRMCALVAEQLGCATEEVLVCSTGLIGFPLPMDAIEQGIPALAAALGPGGGGDAAEAIRTTDTVRKEVVVERDGCTVGGMAKGAAMLAPHMATMLAVLTTDAAVEPAVLRDLLATSVLDTFNALTVDGATSTNDTVIVLASGRSAVEPDVLGAAIHEACASLAAQMAGDAEGATKVVRVRVKGAASREDAERAARKVAESQLVKCSWYGEDPYWGRILSELGSSGARFEIDAATIAYGDVVVSAGGVAVAHDEDAVAAHLAGPHIEVTADLGIGVGEWTLLTNDLTHAYIDENRGTS